MALFSVPPTVPSPDPLRIAVVADHGLIAEAVHTALRGRGYDAVVVRWRLVPGGAEAAARRRRLRRPQRSAGPPPDVALLLSDLDRTEVVRTARTLVQGLDVPWLVLTGSPRGPAWGGLYESGASLIVSSHTPLDATCDLLEDLASGRPPRTGRRRRNELIRAWRTFARQRGELTARLQTLTDREEEVLQQLYSGMAVRVIAEHANVTESTVRSQVKAILRKLEVSSQIAAVAAYGEVQADSTESDADSWRSSPSTR